MLGGNQGLFQMRSLKRTIQREQKQNFPVSVRSSWRLCPLGGTCWSCYSIEIFMSRKKRKVLLCDNQKGQYIGMLEWMYLAMINNSTVIELYDDMLLKSYKFYACQTVESSSPGESHPQALTEPNVNLSIYPAPLIQSISKIDLALFKGSSHLWLTKS